MTRRIEGDRKDFREVYAGRLSKGMNKNIDNGRIFRDRAKKGRMSFTSPRINMPYLSYGPSGEGVHRGPGKPGDVIDKDDDQGKGNKAGEEGQEGVTISVDMEDVLQVLQEHLKLPDMKPKPNQTYEETEIRYNNISLTGPESLRHNRRTMMQTYRRQCASGELDMEDLDFNGASKLVPISSDKRFRQFKEIRKPSSNAVVFFARDWSGSMDQLKCDIISDMSWWIDVWIRRFYDKVERVYIGHDVNAEEVDDKKFYNYRYAGGTKCSSAMHLISKQFENRFPPDKWNIYVLYFTDGENYESDNAEFCKVIQDCFPANIVNMVGITQVLAWNYQDSLKQYVDETLTSMSNLKTTQITPPESPSLSSRVATNVYGQPTLSDEERDRQVKDAIMDLLGAKKEKVSV